MIYANFFSPPVISMLFCLHEATVQGEEKDPRSQIVKFLIKKILLITDSSQQCLTNKKFQEQMISATNDPAFMDKYRESISRVNSFNDFYRELSKMLKTMRSLRNNKLEQGNLIDFLIRRMYIYFEKLDFKEIIQIYEQFDKFRKNQPSPQPQHQFMLTKSIEEIKFNLQNYSSGINPEDVAKRVFELREYDHTNKSSYLQSLVSAGQSSPIEAVSSMHRYFDKSLGNLFQQKSQVSLMSNKINHCILSTAFINLKMNCLQECLQSISQGLRISQNNSDEQSINNCIIYLYRISQQLGKYQQQILLNQHAITHSLNLSNTVLMVYSCLNYSLFEKKYNCSDPNILLMKNRNISWTDALHFSRKKVYSTFQSNCKNIYHSFRSLLIPTFMCKLAVLAHLPELENVLLNPYYQRPHLFQLEVYQQFKENNQLQKHIQITLRYCRCQQAKLLQKQISHLLTLEEQALSPLEIIKIRLLMNRVRLQWGNFRGGHGQAQKLAIYCRRYGFVKEELLQIWMIMLQLQLREGMWHDSQVKTQQILKHCKQQKLKQFELTVTLLGIQGQLHLGADLCSVISELEFIQQESYLLTIRPQFKIIFLETKVLVHRKLYQQLLPNLNLFDECEQLKANEFKLLQEVLDLQLSAKNLSRVKHILLGMYDILLLNPNTVSKSRNQKIKLTLAYCEKVLNIYSTIDTDRLDQCELLDRVIIKLRTSYFS